MDIVESLTDFFWDNCGYLHETTFKPKLRENIKKHLEYKTLVYLESDIGIIAACRFNINDNTAYIIDVAVDKRYRNQDMLNRLFKIGFKLYPMVKTIKFHSADKNKDFIYQLYGR